jgi:hypothetical protein
MCFLSSLDSFATDPIGQQPVLGRNFDFLKPKGIYLGKLLLYPTIQTDIEFTDNVLQNDTRAESDILTIISPAISGKYNHKNKSLNIEFQGNQYLYNEFNALDRFDFRAKLGGAINFSKNAILSTNIIKNRDHARGLENNGGLIDPSEPIQYDTNGFINQLSINAARLKWKFGLEATESLYKNTKRLSDGQTIVQNDRDHKTYSTSIQVTRSTNSGNINSNFSDYQQYLGLNYSYLDFTRNNYIDGFGYTGVDQDRQRVSIMGGIEKKPIGKWSGSAKIGLGYQMTESSTLDNQLSYLVDMDFTYMATPLTNLLFEFDRLFDDSTSAVEGAIETRIGGAIVHEITRGGIIRLGLDYRNRDFQNGQNDDTVIGNIQSSYNLNRKWRIESDLSHAKRDSNRTNGNFDETVFKIGIKRSF